MKPKIKFWDQFQDYVIETFSKLTQVNGDQLSSWAQVFRWHKDFLDDRQSVEGQSFGQSITSESEENGTKISNPNISSIFDVKDD